MHDPSRSLVIGLLAWAVVCSTACERSPEHRDVILVTIDTLRPDHLGLYGYERPTSTHIDRWFGEGAIFERAYSTEASTPPSAVSLLTGLSPQDHGVRVFYQPVPERIPILPELLPDGYASAAFVANVVLGDDALSIASRFDHYDDTVDEIASRGFDDGPIWERRAEGTTDAALRWLDEEADAERPLFLWVHYIDPHGPYAAPDGAPRRFTHDEPRLAPRDKVRAPAGGDEPVDALDWVDDYDEEIAYVDAEVGRLLDGLARTRDLDRALVVLTADHGESMMEHEIWFTHGYAVYEEIIRVPLAMRGPDVPAGRFRTPVSGIDVAPTILAFVGGEVPGAWGGFDLRRPSKMPEDRTIVAEARTVANMFGYWRALIRGESKWVAGLGYGEREITTRRYFDLATDPDELSPEPWPGSTTEEQMLVELIERDPDRGSERAGSDAPAPPKVTEEQVRRLRALGYVHDDEAAD